MTDVFIIGGGAAGLISAVKIKEICPALSLTIAEKLDRTAKKIAVTGNGRCNITNKTVNIENYHGKNPKFAEFSLSNFSNEDVENFFLSLGVPFKEGDSGKMYPYSMQASSVGDALRFRLEKENVNILLNTEVNSIENKDGIFYIKSEDKTFTARAVLIATGGMAGGKLGSDSGYRLLRSMGHKITELTPNIVKIKCDSPLLKFLNGNKIDALVTVKTENGEKSDFGEVLFNNEGLSGPPVLQLSRYVKKNREIFLDLCPEMDIHELENALKQRTENLCGTLSDYFCGMFRKRIGQAIIKMSGFDGNQDIKSISGKEILLAKTIKNMKFLCIGKNGFYDAQVTGGGAETNEFYSETLMSKKVKGLFSAGEVLDIDGDCGGYNLRWAWSSGVTAAMGITDYLRDEK